MVGRTRRWGPRLTKGQRQAPLPAGADFVKLKVNYPPLVQGDNELEIRLVSKDPQGRGSIVLKGVEVAIKYKGE